MASLKLLSRLRNALLIGIAIVVSMGSSYMQTSSEKFVDGTNGSDTNNGLSLSTPWKTIQKALSNAQPGDTIYVRGGTYAENLVVSRTGNASAPIKLTNYNGETVTINGGTNIALRASGTVAYWILEGLTFRSTNRYTLRLGWWGEPLTDHWTVRNNKIYGANYIMGTYHLWENNNIDGTGYNGTGGDAGISDGGDSHHNTYRYNNVHDFTHNNARGIWTQGKTHDSVIEYNTVNNINASGGLGQCIDLDGAAEVEWRHTVRGNVMSNCNYVGIQLENVFDSVVENNIIRNTKPAGIIVISYDAGVGCKNGGENGQYGDTNGDNNCQGDLTNNIIRQNVITTTSYWGAGYGGIMNWYAGGVKVWGNTIVAADGSNNGGINFQGTSSQIKGGSIKNNIVFQGRGPAVCATDLKVFVEESNNLYHRTNNTKPYASGSGCGTDVSIAEYQAMSGKGQQTIMGDPAFKNGSTDTRLTSSSPAIDKGTTIGTSADADGNRRPVGAGVDMGAYEYGNVVPTATSTSTFTPTATLPMTAVPTATATLPATSTAVPATVTPATLVPTNVATSTPLPPTAVPTNTFTPVPTDPIEPSATPTITNTPANTTYSLRHSGYFGAVSYANCKAYGYTKKLSGTTGRLWVRVYVDGVFVTTQQTAKGGSFSIPLYTMSPTYTFTSGVDHNVTLYAQLGNGLWYPLLNPKTGQPGGVINCAAPTPTPTKTFTKTSTPTKTATPTKTLVVTATKVPTLAPTAVPTQVVLPTNTPVVEPTLDGVDNVAEGKQASQSSVWGGYDAPRAVDGNTNGILANNSVIHTNEETHPWWQVDLGNNYGIENIKVWNRKDCCEWRLSNFYVFVSDEPFESTDLNTTLAQPGVTSYFVSGNGGYPTDIEINRTGRYVRVQITGRDSIQIAEVEVFADTTPVQVQPMKAPLTESPNVFSAEAGTATPIPVMPTSTPEPEIILPTEVAPTATLETVVQP